MVDSSWCANGYLDCGLSVRHALEAEGLDGAGKAFQAHVRDGRHPFAKPDEHAEKQLHDELGLALDDGAVGHALLEKLDQNSAEAVDPLADGAALHGVEVGDVPEVQQGTVFRRIDEQRADEVAKLFGTESIGRVGVLEQLLGAFERVAVAGIGQGCACRGSSGRAWRRAGRAPRPYRSWSPGRSFWR